MPQAIRVMCPDFRLIRLNFCYCGLLPCSSQHVKPTLPHGNRRIPERETLLPLASEVSGRIPAEPSAQASGNTRNLRTGPARLSAWFREDGQCRFRVRGHRAVQAASEEEEKAVRGLGFDLPDRGAAIVRFPGARSEFFATTRGSRSAAAIAPSRIHADVLTPDQVRSAHGYLSAADAGRTWMNVACATWRL